jgi:hypothetical protein
VLIRAAVGPQGGLHLGRKGASISFQAEGVPTPFWWRVWTRTSQRVGKHVDPLHIQNLDVADALPSLDVPPLRFPAPSCSR